MSSSEDRLVPTECSASARLVSSRSRASRLSSSCWLWRSRPAVAPSSATVCSMRVACSGRGPLHGDEQVAERPRARPGRARCPCRPIRRLRPTSSNSCAVSLSQPHGDAGEQAVAGAADREHDPHRIVVGLVQLPHPTACGSRAARSSDRWAGSTPGAADRRRPSPSPAARRSQAKAGGPSCPSRIRSHSRHATARNAPERFSAAAAAARTSVPQRTISLSERLLRSYTGPPVLEHSRTNHPNRQPGGGATAAAAPPVTACAWNAPYAGCRSLQLADWHVFE